MWRLACFRPSIEHFDENDFMNNMSRDLAKQTLVVTATTGKNNDITKTVTVTKFSATVSHMPRFSIAQYDPVPVKGNDGLSENLCWPQAIAPKDPGFVLLGVDPYYGGMKPPYNYAADYDPPNNGV